MIRSRRLIVAFLLLFMYLPLSNGIAAEPKTPGNISLKLKGAKQRPVPFSHEIHVQKEKVDCAVCHHRDKNPSHPQACTSCHPVNKDKSGIPQAKGVFHKLCQTCHKEKVAKNVAAPTKCTGCHKD